MTRDEVRPGTHVRLIDGWGRERRGVIRERNRYGWYTVDETPILADGKMPRYQWMGETVEPEAAPCLTCGKPTWRPFEHSRACGQIDGGPA